MWSCVLGKQGGGSQKPEPWVDGWLEGIEDGMLLEGILHTIRISCHYF